MPDMTRAKKQIENRASREQLHVAGRQSLENCLPQVHTGHTRHESVCSSYAPRASTGNGNNVGPPRLMRFVEDIKWPQRYPGTNARCLNSNGRFPGSVTPPQPLIWNFIYIQIDQPDKSLQSWFQSCCIFCRSPTRMEPREGLFQSFLKLKFIRRRPLV